MICTSFVESSGNMTGESSDWKLEENVKKNTYKNVEIFTSCKILRSFCKYDLIEITSWMSRILLLLFQASLLLFGDPQRVHMADFFTIF